MLLAIAILFATFAKVAGIELGMSPLMIRLFVAVMMLGLVVKTLLVGIP